MDRLEDSVHSYSEALKVDPFFIEAFIGRGNALMDFGHKTATRFGRYGDRECKMLLCRISEFSRLRIDCKPWAVQLFGVKQSKILTTENSCFVVKVLVGMARSFIWNYFINRKSRIFCVLLFYAVRK